MAALTRHRLDGGIGVVILGLVAMAALLYAFVGFAYAILFLAFGQWPPLARTAEMLGAFWLATTCVIAILLIARAAGRLHAD